MYPQVGFRQPSLSLSLSKNTAHASKQGPLCAIIKTEHTSSSESVCLAFLQLIRNLCLNRHTYHTCIFFLIALISPHINHAIKP